MVNGLNLDHLFDFQEQAVIRLVDFTSDSNSKQTIVMKAPTGAGKTIILIDYVVTYLNDVDERTAFIWLCPGKGDLEEQSRKKMEKLAPQKNTQTLFDALQNGFTAGSTTFINWELVTKKGNTAIRDSERKNLFDRIAEAHRNHLNFMILIDEEHSNNTAKARRIIDAFAANHIIRVSATAQQNKRYEYFEIDEQDVIDSGLITKAIYVNEGVEPGVDVDTDYDVLLDLADKKRQQIAKRYDELHIDVRPLVLVQFPNGSPATVKAVEKKLDSMGYSTRNGLVSVWMSEDKRDLPDNLTENDGIPVFLLMKQAISTGWDCPRAKILVKLREGMSEQFTIQTIGRIRRMPEAKHYEDDLLDFCYVYTFDEEYKAGLLSSLDKAYETRRLFLKEKCKTFTLEKQIRDQEFHGLGEKEVWEQLYRYMVQKYHLSTASDTVKRYKDNETILRGFNYHVGGQYLLGRTLQGTFVKTTALQESESFIATKQRVDTHKHGRQLLHCTDELKRIIGVPTNKTKTILERLFRKGKGSQKILGLDTGAFYAFIINNVQILKEVFREAASKTRQYQQDFWPQPKESVFHIPEQDFFRYDPSVKEDIEYLSNAYKEYSSGCATSLIRSDSERLFERYCEYEREDIDWVYKNGDTGQQYFSIVYLDSLMHQWLFYADYIIKKKDGTVWVIETKGGEAKGKDKNIDRQIQNKFEAFRQYAEQKHLHWGFVRDKDDRLYINNTVFAENLSDDHWRPIGEVF